MKITNAIVKLMPSIYNLKTTYYIVTYPILARFIASTACAFIGTLHISSLARTTSRPSLFPFHAARTLTIAVTFLHKGKAFIKSTFIYLCKYMQIFTYHFDSFSFDKLSLSFDCSDRFRQFPKIVVYAQNKMRTR